MIAGNLVVFRGEEEDFQDDVLIEVTDIAPPHIEVAFDYKGKRFYLRFRSKDFNREIREMKGTM